MATHIYSDAENNVVDVVNGPTLVKAISFASKGPEGVIYSSAEKEIYATLSTSDTVVPITSTETVGSAITVGSAPTAGCYVPSSDQVLITYQGQTSPDASVTLIGTNNAVAATVPLGSKATTPEGCAES